MATTLRYDTRNPAGRSVRLNLAPRLAVAALLGLGALAGGAGQAHAATQISVNATQLLSTVAPSAVGVNSPVWDTHLRDAAVPGLLKAAGTNLMRFPGGSYADMYHWENGGSITKGFDGYIAPGNSFDNFMKSDVMAAGAGAMVTVNYGSNAAGTAGGDPGEAAAWVGYANTQQHYGVRYWEIGNEVYGNGYYGSDWEVDLHSLARGKARVGDPNLSPATYAQNVKQFSQQMKAADPSAQIGIVLTTPGFWPDGVTRVGKTKVQAWNPTVLAGACQYADFAIVHWYPETPGNESDARLLAKPGTIAGEVAALHSLFSTYCGSHQLGIMVTETNSVPYSPGKQTTNLINGLFTAGEELAWLQNGASNVTWFDLHNGAELNNTQENGSLYGTLPYGDYGMLANGSHVTDKKTHQTYYEPSANTPFPSYYGLQVDAPALVPGSQFVQVTSSSSALQVFATIGGGGLTLVVINTDGANAYTFSPTFSGFLPVSGTVTSFGSAQPTPAASSLTVQNFTFTYTLPAYSMAVFSLAPHL
ncbi:MAG TPA: cellulose-binding protein [Chloroflexota bacterium]|nr:cellulose-binding protein [Chloroflexota bacterium]